MSWSFREYMYKLGSQVNMDPPCTTGLDVAFILDYTGSMGAVIDSIKGTILNIITEIENQVVDGDYRLGLVISDEYSGTTGVQATYQNSGSYISLPPSQKIVDTGVGITQYITAMELFAVNNQSTFIDQLDVLNTSNFPIGNGAQGAEPLDVALDFVVNNAFLTPFRTNVAKYVFIFTDDFPGGDDDTYDTIDDDRINTLTTDCIREGIKVFVLGEGANETVWQNLATNTGGLYNVDFDEETIISAITNTCT